MIRGWIAVALMAGTAAACAVAPARAAAVINVATTGTDAAGCGGTTAPCKTIAYAYGLAAAGDTVKVAPGTYPMAEPLSIQKAGLNFVGAKAGVDARTRTAGGPGESVITQGPGFPFQVSTWGAAANGVTVDGFTFRGNYAGLQTTATASGYTVVDNIFTNNTLGYYLNSDGATTSLVQHNLFVANNNSSTGSFALGNAIYSDQGVRNVAVQQNKFRGNENGPVEVDCSASPIVTCFGLTVRDNDMNTDSVGVDFIDVSDSSVTANSMIGGQYSGVQVSGGDHGITVSDNVITGHGRDGVRVVSQTGVPNTGIAVTDNLIVSAARTGVEVAGSSAVMIRHNLILNSGQAGVGFTPPPAGSGPASAVTVTQNTILGKASTDPGIVVDAGAYTGPMAVHYNRIVYHPTRLGLVNDDPAAVIDARLNWWGCNSPQARADCDHVTGSAVATVTWHPQLILTLRTSPAAIAAGQRARVFASLQNDSAGGTPPGPFFHRFIFSFSARPGREVPGRVLDTVRQHARTIWPAAQPEPREICVTADDQTLCVHPGTAGPAPAPGSGPSLPQVPVTG